MNRPTTEQPKAVCPAQRMMSLFLASWILLLSLAGVSPALHDWMHGAGDHASSTCPDSHPNKDPQSTEHDAHVCAVTLLHSSVQVWVPETHISNPLVADFNYLIEVESSPITQGPTTHQSRAPPIEQIV